MVKYSPAIFIIQYYSELSNHSSIFKSTHQTMTHTSWQKIAGCLAT